MILHTLGSILAGWLLADLIAGIVHWWEDRIASPDWPLLGKHVVIPNRLHHEQPMAFLAASVIERNWTTAAAAWLIGGALMMVFGPSILLGTAIVGGTVANEVHRYAHRPNDAPAWLHAAQRTGLLQSPAGHARHHRGNQDSNYCVLTDWLNPWLELIGVWRWLDRLCGVRS